MTGLFKKTFLAVIIPLLAFGLIFYYYNSKLKSDKYPFNPDTGHFKTVRIIDGDTFVVMIYDIQMMVRLAGIDAPEMPKRRFEGQPYCQKAKDFLEKMVLGKHVDIKGYGIEKYGRQLAEVFADGTNVNLELVKAGLAEIYDGRLPKGFDVKPYQQAEAEAKEAKKGIWSLEDKYISPKVWRENNKRLSNKL